MVNARPETIRIGIGAPLSGNAAALGIEMKQVIEVAVDEQNANGGSLGLRRCAISVSRESPIASRYGGMKKATIRPR